MDFVERASKAKTGIWGLDNILSGGFWRGHVFLVEGAPGTGKSTIALQFLLEGIRAGEKCLYITLSETERELRQGAASHGWKLVDDIFELLPPESLLGSEQRPAGTGKSLLAIDPLDGFQGILHGVPIYVGEALPLMQERAL